MKPLRPPAQIFRAGFVADAAFLALDFVADFAPDFVADFALGFVAELALDFAALLVDPAALLPDDFFGVAEPNVSARAGALDALFGDGAGAWPSAGAAMIADARRKRTLDDCTALGSEGMSRGARAAFA